MKHEKFHPFPVSGFPVLKKNSVEIWLILKKKNRKNFENNFCNFFYF